MYYDMLGVFDNCTFDMHNYPKKCFMLKMSMQQLKNLDVILYRCRHSTKTD